MTRFHVFKRKDKPKEQRQQSEPEGDIVITERLKGDLGVALNVFISQKVEGKITEQQIKNIIKNADDIEGVIHSICIFAGFRYVRHRIEGTDYEAKLIIKCEI